MAIIYDANQKLFSLNTKSSTYQMQVDRHGTLIHLYYGPPNIGFPDTPLMYADRGFSGNPYMAGNDRHYSLDWLPQEYPTLGMGDYRHYALNIENPDGSEYCALFYDHHEVRKGKYSLRGLPAVWTETDDEAETLEVVLKDPWSDVEVSLLYGVLPERDIITRAAIIRNRGSERIRILKAAAATLDYMTGEYDLITFFGRHAMERQVDRRRLSHGVCTVGSRRGTSSHEYNPAVILTRSDTTEDTGPCWGMVFVYSGNFLCEAEKDQFDQTRLTMGLNSEFFAYPLEPGGEFTVPEVILSFSADGISRLSQQFQTCIRRNVCRGRYALAKRPIVINSWEAAYFDFSSETILDLARQASELGIDMVVMDDGWFGVRDDDNSSLGDWYVNIGKLGEPLSDLIRKVNSYGVQFGIWFEPEMVSENSRMFREHPDWAIRIKGRPPVRGRNQLLLDFSRKEVRENIFEQICSVLDQGNIQYIKWDMNRSMTDVYSGRLTYDYMLGLYEFLGQLIERYPNVLIEGCSGGGGRFDAGMLYYTPQIWCSDNTDAINRTRIQYGTSFIYPVSAVASHVSAVPNHQTGRVVNLATRGVVAMTGAFGYELDPAKLTLKEREEVREQVETYKKYEHLISNGLYYRLSDPMKDANAAWMEVAQDGSQALLSVVRLYVEANMPPTYIRLKGLDPDELYIETSSGKVFTGQILMQTGFPLPFATKGYEAYQLLFQRLDDVLEVARIVERKLGAGSDRITVGVYGCSGSGKSTLTNGLAQYLARDGISSVIVTGDEYARRIPVLNDEERARLYEEGGEEALRAYLGTAEELDFEGVDELLGRFKDGDQTLQVRYLGRKEGELRDIEVDARNARVLILEWTHAGAPELRGMDLKVYIDSTPEATLQRRIARGRDANAGTDLIRTVLEIEQERLVCQAKDADIIVSEDGQVHEK